MAGVSESTARRIDPITISTIWHSLRTTCREMRHVIEHTAQSYLIGQLKDVSVGLWRANGDTICMAEGLPSQFLGSRFAIAAMIEKFGNDLSPGDVILSNDPYGGGHTCHLPDWGFFRPIFYRDELLFWTLARGHQEDTGGAFPGGYFPNGYDIHAEGLRIPPIKVIAAGKERSDVFELLWNNVRWPRGTRVDNYSLIAATVRAQERVIGLIEKYGRDTVLGTIDELIERTESAVRAEIRQIPDGTYHGESATDDDGTELGVPVWVRVDVTVAGDEMTLDFSRSDPQRKGFVNCVYALTYGQAITGPILFFDPSIASYHNEGTLRPIHVVAPPGSVVNAQYPATVGASPVSVGTQIMEAVMQALSEAVPERAMAAWARRRGDKTFGFDPRTQQPYVRSSFDYDGSGGAVWGFDGYSAAGPLGTLGIVSRGNIEEEEMRFPWRVLHWEFEPDLTGAGRWRGGPGIRWEAMNEGGDGTMATGSSDGEVTVGHGTQGGEPTPLSWTYLRRNGTDTRVQVHSMVPLKPGDVVVKFGSGGGGVGNPRERDPAAVAADVKKGFVSLEAAASVYAVVLNQETFEIDEDATRALRGA